VNEKEFFALVAERDAARRRVDETYAAYKRAEDRANAARPDLEPYYEFHLRFEVEELAYQSAENEFRSLNQRVEFALETAKRETFALGIAHAKGMAVGAGLADEEVQP
jgi:hypothetical protein